MRNEKGSIEIGLGGILTIIFVVMKLMGKIDWAWWKCFLPVIIGVVVGLIVLAVAIAIGIKTNE